MTVQETLYSMDVEADTGMLSDVREFVRQHSISHGFREKEIGEIELAVDEAFTNIIKHAYRGRSDSNVRIRMWFSPDRLSISLFDTGCSFNRESYTEPNIQTLAHRKKKGGMGVFLIKKLMDDVEYKKSDDGNEIRMTKRLSPSAS